MSVFPRRAWNALTGSLRWQILVAVILTVMAVVACCAHTHESFAMTISGSCASATAHGYKRKTLEIVHPWTTEKADANGREASVGLTIRNSGKQAERLLSAISAVADSVELRPDSATGSKSGSAVTIVIKPGQEVHLRPSGAHVRLIGLKKSLTPHDTLTLTFERAGRISVDVMVEEESSTAK